MYEYLADANSMLNNILKLQFQQIVKHPHIMSVWIPNFSKTYIYKTIVKSCRACFYVLKTGRCFICIHTLHQKTATAF